MRSHLMEEFNFGDGKQPNVEKIQQAQKLVKPEDFKKRPYKKRVKRLDKGSKQPVGKPKKK